MWVGLGVVAVLALLLASVMFDGSPGPYDGEDWDEQEPHPDVAWQYRRREFLAAEGQDRSERE